MIFCKYRCGMGWANDSIRGDLSTKLYPLSCDVLTHLLSSQLGTNAMLAYVIIRN